MLPAFPVFLCLCPHFCLGDGMEWDGMGVVSAAGVAVGPAALYVLRGLVCLQVQTVVLYRDGLKYMTAPSRVCEIVESSVQSVLSVLRCPYRHFLACKPGFIIIYCRILTVI